MTTTYPTYSDLNLTQALIERQGLEQSLQEFRANNPGRFPSYFLGCLEIIGDRITELSRHEILAQSPAIPYNQCTYFEGLCIG